MEELCEQLYSLNVSSEEEEFKKLTYSQIFSLKDLISAYKSVITSSTVRYKRYIKNIYFDYDEDASAIKVKILECLATTDIIKKIKQIRSIDKALILYLYKDGVNIYSVPNDLK